MSACAPHMAPSPDRPGRRTVNPMGDTWEQKCAGPDRKTSCPKGEVLTIDAGIPEYRCDDCRHYWELDATEPGRRVVEDVGLTRPLGDPGEAGHGSAA